MSAVAAPAIEEMAPARRRRRVDGLAVAGGLIVVAAVLLAVLAPRPGETVIDCTFGAGGHSALLAERLRGEGKLIAIDRDPTVAPYFARVKRASSVKMRLLSGEFSTVLEHLAANDVHADAILLDLGVSSMQLEGAQIVPPG